MFNKVYTCLVKEKIMWQSKPLGSYLVDKFSSFSFSLDEYENIFQDFKKLVEPYLRKNNYLFIVADDLIKLYETTYKALVWFRQYEEGQYRYLLNQGYNYYLSNLESLINIMFNYAVNAYLEEENTTTKDFLEEVKKYLYQYFSATRFDCFNISEKEIYLRSFTINGQLI